MSIRRTVGSVLAAVVCFAVVASAGSGRGEAATGPDLNEVISTLNKTMTVSGTTWGIDSASEKVLVTYDATVVAAKLELLKAILAPFGEAIDLRATPGYSSLLYAGGNIVFPDQRLNPPGVFPYYCSLGFNAESPGGVDYFFTAGHCTYGKEYWYGSSSNTNYLGHEVSSIDGQNGWDFGNVRWDNFSVEHRGQIYLYRSTNPYQDITTSRDGQRSDTYVCKSGATTHVTCGSVLNPCVNRNVGGVTYYCQTETNICAEGGDSGGPLYSGGAGLGMVANGNIDMLGNCLPLPNTRTYFQRISTVQNYYGIYLY